MLAERWRRPRPARQARGLRLGLHARRPHLGAAHERWRQEDRRVHHPEEGQGHEHLARLQQGQRWEKIIGHSTFLIHGS